MRYLSKKLSDLQLRTKLSILIIGSTLLILMVNIFMYYNLNRITLQIDEVYVGNVKLNELSDALDMVQSSMRDYLNTKNTDSLDEYYRAAQKYSDLTNELDVKISDNHMILMERSIYWMSQKYIGLTEETIDSKRGRNIEKYKDRYEKASEIYSYINSYITSLNEYRFRANTESYNALSSAVGYLEFLSIIMFAVLIAFDIMLVLLVTRNITQPLLDLSIAADMVSAGELDKVEQVKVHSKDEVGVVTEAFNQMVSSIPGYLTRLKDSMEKEQLLKEKELMMEAHLKDAHLKYLQAQINPHFLFNTMNAGTQLAMMEHADRTYEYIQNVAAFFRYNVSEKDEVTLREEIELVDTYIYILNVRFAGDIHFSKEIESDELLNVKLPGMVLQPIVENCVNYGIRDIEREGKIMLSVYAADANVYISVADNGVGMKQEIIQSILSGNYTSEDIEASKDKKGNGVGLKNVIERLKLYFDDKNSVEIISNGRDQGTEVVITIPYKEI
ncbi:MAG TPA: two-component sensor histidine kinase [Lachnospiraceae bacterium]|nr:two-component sensor histidine kinase [Lachnospiraceae bacterium]